MTNLRLYDCLRTSHFPSWLSFLPGDNCILTFLRPPIVWTSIVLDWELVGCGLGDNILNGFVDAKWEMWGVDIPVPERSNPSPGPMLLIIQKKSVYFNIFIE